MLDFKISDRIGTFLIKANNDNNIFAVKDISCSI